MREIKFRGLIELIATGKKRWVYYTPSTKPSLVGAIWIVEDSEYTGLKDKNSKEIYEGDIIQRYSEGRYKIYWHERSASWLMDGHTGITMGDMALACEVIGNIYENSELLKS